VAVAFDNPKGMRLKWHRPLRVQNADLSWALSDMAICEYPAKRSMVAKYLPPVNCQKHPEYQKWDRHPYGRPHLLAYNRRKTCTSHLALWLGKQERFRVNQTVQ